MAATSDRIAQLEKLIADDGENEMAHFSLANAYAQAGRFEDAARGFLRCTELAPGMSKAYQVAAENFIMADLPDDAAAVAARGFEVASERGDRLPRDAMAALLQSLGRPLPEVKQHSAGAAAGGGGGGAASAQAAMPLTDGFTCRKTKRPGTKMPRPPFRGPVGEWIQNNIAQQTFNEWIGMGTKIINELRLDLSRDEDEKVYDFAMLLYVGLDAQMYTQLSGKQPPQIDADMQQLIARVLNAGDDEVAALRGSLGAGRE